MIISDVACEMALVKRGWTVVDLQKGIGPCWEVNGAHTGAGYVQVSVTPKLRLSAHRAAHIAWIGQIPPGAVIRHHCDNPPCINPRHLVAGSQKQNVQDALLRGRRLKGQAHYNAKLKDADVLDIVDRWKSGESMTSLGRTYGVSKTQIAHIVKGRQWRHLTAGILDATQ